MAASEILATGSGAGDSTDVTVASGGSATVCLKNITQYARAVVSLKDDGGVYVTIGHLDSKNPAMALGTGTWRVSREAGASCGVFSA